MKVYNRLHMLGISTLVFSQPGAHGVSGQWSLMADPMPVDQKRYAASCVLGQTLYGARSPQPDPHPTPPHPCARAALARARC